MDWTVVEAEWADWVGWFRARWPELEADRLEALQGDRAGMVRYLSETYELTLLEADEALDEIVLRLDARSAA